MSLIHDALKKLEKGEAASSPQGSSPSPHAAFSPPKIAFPPRQIILLSILGVMIVWTAITYLKPAPSPKKSPKKESKVSVPKVAAKPVLPVIEEKKEEPALLPEVKATETPPSSPSISLSHSFVLNGIVAEGAASWAIINNKITRVGEEIDGATLMEVQKDTVMLRKGEERFLIKMR